MPNYNQYKIFCSVAQELSMTKAAELEHLTTSAISHSIRNLEESLGRKLVEKNGNRIRLTKEGKELYRKIFDHFQAIDKIDREYRLGLKEEKTTKVIATTHTFLNDFLLPNTELLREAFPNAVFRIETCSMSEVQELVLSGKADIGLILMDGKEADDLITYPIRIIRELFATRNMHVSRKEVLPAVKILDHQLVTIHSDSKSFAFYQNHFSKFNVSLTPEIEVRQMDIICQLLKRTNAVGIIYDYLLDKLRKEDASFKELLLQSPLPGRVMAFIKKKSLKEDETWGVFLKKFKGALTKQ